MTIPKYTNGAQRRFTLVSNDQRAFEASRRLLRSRP